MSLQTPRKQLYLRTAAFLSGLAFFAFLGAFGRLLLRLPKRWTGHRLPWAAFVSRLGYHFSEALFPGIITLAPFEDFYYRVAGLSHPARVAPGERFPVEVRLRNMGRLTWGGHGDGHPVRLGTWNPENRLSPFHDPASWPLADRPGGLAGPVAPAREGRFALTFRAPLKAGRYREELAPVADGLCWFPGERIVIELRVEDVR